MNNFVSVIMKPAVLDFRGIKAYLFEISFITFAVAFPALGHALQWNVWAILPMHWAVLLAGMVYGWRAGLIAGILSPLVSFFITGMPPVFILPIMTVELALYGFVPGFLRKKFSLNTFTAIFAGLIAGRAGYVAISFFMGHIEEPLLVFLQGKFQIGLIAAVIQLITIPFITSALVMLQKQDKK